ncbi:DUF2279 domain-containing protein [soil metagenome]
MRSRIFLALLLLPVFCFAQLEKESLQDGMNQRPKFFQPAFHFDKKRTALVVGTEVALSAGTLIALSQVWYKDYPHTNFHFFNDNGEWEQMDKAGHCVTAYTVGRYGIRLLEWSGVSRKKAIWFGGLTGFAYQGGIEMLDGFSSGWGFSFGDISSNAIGCGFLIGQEFLWKEQRITFKYSFHKSNYAAYRPDLLGTNRNEQFIKDYNGQTYWASVNIASFLKDETKFPEFLNLAFGYGADGMTGGHANPPMINAAGNTITLNRYRQYYLSFDIDLTKIPAHSYFLKTIFETFGFLKIPAPGIELSQGKMYGKVFMY